LSRFTGLLAGIVACLELNLRRTRGHSNGYRQGILDSPIRILLAWARDGMGPLPLDLLIGHGEAHHAIELNRSYLNLGCQSKICGFGS
jgi:hypothetical protein